MRNKRPDLRRDCDGCIVSPKCWLMASETNDLIYEGIATRRNLPNIAFGQVETNDLIYEGIATSEGVLNSAPQFFRNKRPDLRRDCDRSPWDAVFLRASSRNKRPDLRRDCDHPQPRQLRHELHLKQTTWFTKGLRLFAWNLLFCDILNETNDLIYEGIATYARLLRSSCGKTAKQTTWFTKGLRLGRDMRCIASLLKKQTTWFTKGLRLWSIHF